MQERRNSIALAMELRPSCISPSIYSILQPMVCVQIQNKIKYNRSRVAQFAIYKWVRGCRKSPADYTD